MHGAPISGVEILDVSRQGFQLSLAGGTLHLAYTDFPWFAGATIAQLREVQWPSPDHLYWPALDIDLSMASIRTPAAFPLIAKVQKVVS